MIHNTQRFTELNQILLNYSELWQFLPFYQNQIPWENSFPELHTWLLHLSDDQVAHYSEQPEKLEEVLHPLLPELSQLNQLSALPHKTYHPSQSPFWLQTGIPGRKWTQIDAFTQLMPEVESEVDIIEWCAGKGFLGRLIAFQHKANVTSLEWQQPLCDKGNLAAEKLSLPIDFQCADVLKGEGDSFLQPNKHTVALHACGELHMHLLRQGCDNHANGFSVSPCCYHLIPNDEYQPLSSVGQTSQLKLSRKDLQLPLQETVTAGNRVKQLRETEISWRLGFDCLYRHLTHTDEYVPVPSVAKSIFQTSFSEFCHWAATKKGIEVPNNIHLDSFLEKGQVKNKQIQKIDLIRNVFRRPIETWLILDRVLFLEESGYTVDFFEFCDKSVTPRNILINALRNK